MVHLISSDRQASGTVGSVLISCCLFQYSKYIRTVSARWAVGADQLLPVPAHHDLYHSTHHILSWAAGTMVSAQSGDRSQSTRSGGRSLSTCGAAGARRELAGRSASTYWALGEHLVGTRRALGGCSPSTWWALGDHLTLGLFRP